MEPAGIKAEIVLTKQTGLSSQISDMEGRFVIFRIASGVS